jgi:hypothetical protein
MHKLYTAASVVASLVVAPQAAFAAPSSLVCADANAKNCFRDEVFILDGNNTVQDSNGNAVPLASCASTTDCYIRNTGELFSQVGLQAVVGNALGIIQAQTPLPGWDEVVVFYADFGPAKQPGPLFFRAKNAAGAFVNRVANINTGDLAEPDPDKPYLGIIDGGNVKGFGTTPSSSKYSPCGAAPRLPTDSPPSQANGAICAPGVHSYFDALAQATAALYGPHLAGPVDPSVATPPALDGGTPPSPVRIPLVAPPTIKSTIVDSTGASKFPTSGLSVDTWNALLDTEGSVLGGNTWRNDGTGMFSVGNPPTNLYASAPYQGTQMVSFQPMDLYVLGFAPSSAVPDLTSYAKATASDVFFPTGITKFTTAVGPNMGTRIGGVSLRPRSGLPAPIKCSDIVAAHGGERSPGAADAPQFIRQLWILVTKPDTIRDQVAAAAGSAPGASSTATTDSVKAQGSEQTTEITNLQKFRRAWGAYFYTLTQYTGRAVSTFEGNVDDTAYWEFADPTDDGKVFTANGLDMAMPGVQTVPNSGGKKTSLLSIKHTPGSSGTLSFKATSALGLRLQGSTKASPSPNNVFTIRMRVPADPNQVGKAHGHVVLSGSKGNYEFDFPSMGNLVPDGRFRNYSVLLSQRIERDPNATNDGGAPVEATKVTEITDFTGKDYDSFTITPSSVDMSGLDIEFIKIFNSSDAKDVDLDCDGHAKPDGWLGAEDNCPNLYNPDQTDSNGDGVGDACEDFDGDGVPNACDDCAAVGGTGKASHKHLAVHIGRS